MSRKQNILFLFFLAFLALAIFSPIANNDYLPNSRDLANHIVAIAEAKDAISQGQFPIRIAPNLYNGWQYPYFQFYSPLPFTLAGICYKWITPENPFIALKLVIFLSLIFAGIFTFKLSYEFFKSVPAALLSSTVYLFSPYLILNIDTRCFFPESVALCLIPWVLYCSVKYHREGSLNFFLLTVLAWFILIITHLITFFCSTLFMGLFFIFMNIDERLPFKRLFGLAAAYGYAVLIAAWFLAPIIILEPYLYEPWCLSNPYTSSWMNPLTTLFAPHPVSPTPLPGPENGRLYFPFYVGVGWPLLIAVGIALYKKSSPLINYLIVLFFLLLFLIWSPFNFWDYLPGIFKITQFSSRFLSQLNWIGTLLFAYAVVKIFGETIDLRHVGLGILLIGVANGSWLMTNQESNKTLQDLITHRKFYVWGADAYVMNPIILSKEHPMLIKPEYLKSSMQVATTHSFCTREKNQINCSLTILRNQLIQLPALYYPHMQEIKVDGKLMPYQPIPQKFFHQPMWPKVSKELMDINPLLVGVKIPAGHHTVEVTFTGMKWANYISLTFFILLFFLVIYAYLPVKESDEGLASAKD